MLTCIFFSRISLPTMQTTNSCVYLQHLMKKKNCCDWLIDVKAQALLKFGDKLAGRTLNAG
jgi:hypothetical protein